MKIELSQAQKMLEWLKIKLYLDSISANSKTRTVKRGQVYRCNFGCGIGSEMQKERPAVIIQNDIGNSKSGNTIVVPITHDTSILPCVANITPQIDILGNIILDGQANISNIACVSKARLGDFICTLPSSDMRLIDSSLAKTLDIMRYYADIHQKLTDKRAYISLIKETRNKVQDELTTIKMILGLTDKDSLIKCIEEMKITIDNQKENL